MQARAAVKGQSLVTDAAPIFYEYVMRQRMHKLGFVTDFSKLTAWKADCFYLIDVEIDSTQEQEANRRGRKHR